jgi:uncharacterized protein YraI
MTQKKNLMAIAAILGGVVFGSSAATAHPVSSPASGNAEASLSLNVRSGPGTNYRVIDTLRPGENVEITRRSGGWCYVIKNGPDGWASCRYLVDTSRGAPRRDRGEPSISFSFSIPGFGITVGDGEFDFDRPRRPDRSSRVCFYEHVGYDGDSFCMRPGESRRSLGDWNDTISSIRVRGGAEALVCEHNNYNGRCVVVDSNVSDLRPRGNDIISSIRVR